MRIILPKPGAQRERHDRQPGVVIRARLVLLAKHRRLDPLERKLALLPMNVADADIPPARLQRLAQQPRVRHAILHDAPIPRKPQVDEVKVLRDDLRARPRKVQRVRLLRAAEVVQLEDEVFWQLRLVAPDDEADACEAEAKLVPGRVDALDARELKVPFGASGLYVGKGRDEAA